MTTFTVNSIGDVNDGNLNNGITTLREAIEAANQIPGDDSITFNFGGTPQTIKLTSALPIINSNIEIKGTSKDTLTINGDSKYRVFFVYAGTVRISSLSIANGYAKGGDGGNGSVGGGGGAGAGGGLFVNSGTVTIDNVVFSNNQAIGGKGGDGSSSKGDGGGGGLVDLGNNGDSGNGGRGGSSGLDSLLGNSGGAGGQLIADYPVPIGYNYSVTNGQPGNFGGGGGGGYSGIGYLDFTTLSRRPDSFIADQYGLGGNGGDFSGGGGGSGGSGNGGFGGGGGGGNGLGNSGGGSGVAGTVNRSDIARVGAGSSAFDGAYGGGGGGAGMGGAIFVNSSSLVMLSNITLSNNATRGGQGGLNFGSGDRNGGEAGKGKGGAIYVRSGGTVNLVKDTFSFSGNDAADNDPRLLEQDNENIFGAYTFGSIAPPLPPKPQPLIGNDTIRPTSGNDTIIGTAGADRLLGLGGNDTITGGDGNDFLNGGKGKDTLSGGKGKDKFLLRRGVGRDLIQDFQDKQDKLVLAGKLKFKDLDILQRGKGTLVSAGKEQLAFLKNVNANLITAADFTRSLR